MNATLPGNKSDIFELMFWRISNIVGNGPSKKFYEEYQNFVETAQPNALDDNIWLVRIHMLAGSFRSAFSILKLLSEGHQENSSVALLMAKCLYEIGCESYHNSIKKIIKIDPSNLEATLLIARHYLINNTPSKAMRYYRRAFILSNYSYDAVIGAAASALENGEMEKSEEWARRALDIDGNRPEGRIAIAALLHKKDPISAFQNYLFAANTIYPFVPTPPSDQYPEARRGLCTILRSIIGGNVNKEIFSYAKSVSKTIINGDAYSIDCISDISTIPMDMQFHARDKDHTVFSRRLSTATVQELPLPLNYKPVCHMEPIFKSSLVNWARFTYKKYNWDKLHQYPYYYGSDGDFITQVNNAKIVDNYIFSHDDEFIDDSYIFDEFVTIYTKRRFIQYDNCISMVHEKEESRIRICVPCISLFSYHFNSILMHYAIWIIDILSKFILFESIPETHNLPIVLPKRAFETPYVRETLYAMGIPDSRLIIIDEGTFCFDRLYLVQSQSILFSPIHVGAVRRRLFDGFKVTATNKKRRIYLSREDANHRRAVNDDALMSMLSRFGFERIESTPLSMRDRAQIFSEAELVVGIVGAGLGNIIFCPPGAHVIMIMPYTVVDMSFCPIAHSIGIEYFTEISNTVVNDKNDFVVSIENIESIISNFGAK